MALVLDIVDLLQLQELWGRRPIITAFTRLEQRRTSLACAVDFSVDGLILRLSRLKNSPVWRSNRANLANDPARIPLGSLSEEYLNELYPESPSPAAARQALFLSAYNHFVVIQYRGDVRRVQAALRALAGVRGLAPGSFLDASDLPYPGAPDWIPADITDEIRSLDTRYEMAQPDAPATYVVSDEFWTILVKTDADDIQRAAQHSAQGDSALSPGECRQQLAALVEIAQLWNRSPSVVGLCYQVAENI